MIQYEAGAAVVGAVQVSDLGSQPGQVQHAIDGGQDVIVGNELAQRAGNEQLKLTTLLARQHPILRAARLRVKQPHHTSANPGAAFSTGPSCPTDPNLCPERINRGVWLRRQRANSARYALSIQMFHVQFRKPHRPEMPTSLVDGNPRLRKLRSSKRSHCYRDDVWVPTQLPVDG